jgi:hypothetical protein
MVGLSLQWVKTSLAIRASLLGVDKGDLGEIGVHLYGPKA